MASKKAHALVLLGPVIEIIELIGVLLVMGLLLILAFVAFALLSGGVVAIAGFFMPTLIGFQVICWAAIIGGIIGMFSALSIAMMDHDKYYEKVEAKDKELIEKINAKDSGKRGRLSLSNEKGGDLTEVK